MVSADWSLHCTACGRCCNSPPLLSLDELWQHRHTFIGCISVRRLPRNASAGQRALAAQLLPGGAADDLVLLLQGYQWASQPSCPALQSDQRCGVHGAHKPATCRVVPLDALLPDAEQASCCHNAPKARPLSGRIACSQTWLARARYCCASCRW